MMSKFKQSHVVVTGVLLLCLVVTGVWFRSCGGGGKEVQQQGTQTTGGTETGMSTHKEVFAATGDPCGPLGGPPGYPGPIPSGCYYDRRKVDCDTDGVCGKIEGIEGGCPCGGATNTPQKFEALIYQGGCKDNGGAPARGREKDGLCGYPNCSFEKARVLQSCDASCVVTRTIQPYGPLTGGGTLVCPPTISPPTNFQCGIKPVVPAVPPATASPETMVFSWIAPGDGPDAGYDLRFDVTTPPSSETQNVTFDPAAGGNYSYDKTSAGWNKQYTAWVRSVKGALQSSWNPAEPPAAGLACKMPPGPPTMGTFCYPSATQLRIRWTNSYGGHHHYNIHRYSAAEGGEKVCVNMSPGATAMNVSVSQSPAPPTTCSSAVKKGGTYAFWVEACDDSVPPAKCSTAASGSVTPNPPGTNTCL